MSGPQQPGEPEIPGRTAPEAEPGAAPGAERGAEAEPGPAPERAADGSFDPWAGPDRWAGGRRSARRRQWQAQEGSGPGPWGGGGPWSRRGWRGGPRHPARFVGCLLVSLIVFIGLVSAVSTWVAGVVLGTFAPGSGPSGRGAAAILIVIVVVLLFSGRIFGSAAGPLAEIATATERLADGESGVRVAVRGPRPVRRLAGSFNAMAGRLDSSRSERQALLADVTHELRTPLTVIGGGVEAMLDGIHPRDDEHLAPILAETQVMGRLLEDLRTLSLAEAGALPLHREATDLRALAGDVIDAHRPAAMAGGVTLALEPGQPLVTDVDPLRIREVLANLVTNAIRHTPGGGTIRLGVRRDHDDAELVIADTGEGIPPADLERVFDRFHRRADSGGSGLGLTIARDLVAAHGGTISAESDGIAGHGAVFRVRIPLRD